MLQLLSCTVVSLLIGLTLVVPSFDIYIYIYGYALYYYKIVSRSSSYWLYTTWCTLAHHPFIALFLSIIYVYMYNCIYIHVYIYIINIYIIYIMYIYNIYMYIYNIYIYIYIIYKEKNKTLSFMFSQLPGFYFCSYIK